MSVFLTIACCVSLHISAASRRLGSMTSVAKPSGLYALRRGPPVRPVHSPTPVCRQYPSGKRCDVTIFRYFVRNVLLSGLLRLMLTSTNPADFDGHSTSCSVVDARLLSMTSVRQNVKCQMSNWGWFSMSPSEQRPQTGQFTIPRIYP